MKTLTLVRGLPGAGKTTLAQKIAKSNPATQIIAADDYSGLYVDGVYQSHLQKESHAWCQKNVEIWMSRGATEIIIHNTFAQFLWMKTYFELAKKYDYTIHVVHSEAVIFPDGSRTESTHNVPKAIIQSMRQRWEPLNPPIKMGMTTADIAVQMAGLQLPDAIIFDMDKTLKLTASGEEFPQSPEDFRINPVIKEWAKNYDDWCELYIASNQRGLATGAKTREFLEREIAFLIDELTKHRLRFDECYFVPGYNEHNSLVYADGDWYETASTDKVYDKPDTGIYQDILTQHNPDIKVCWIVGDAHTDKFYEDWQFAQACIELDKSIDVRYVPIEMLNIYWQLAKSV